MRSQCSLGIFYCSSISFSQLISIKQHFINGCSSFYSCWGWWRTWAWMPRWWTTGWKWCLDWWCLGWEDALHQWWRFIWYQSRFSWGILPNARHAAGWLQSLDSWLFLVAPDIGACGDSALSCVNTVATFQLCLRPTEIKKEKVRDLTSDTAVLWKPKEMPLLEYQSPTTWQAGFCEGPKSTRGWPSQAYLRRGRTDESLECIIRRINKCSGVA